ncbi:UNVERIFIED_CONTAM: hypothetical protein GTU68_035254 [Idotea baltica]|nr:hypothetical protein [Idotea baltica]
MKIWGSSNLPESKLYTYILILLLIHGLGCTTKVIPPPEAVFPIPSERQLAWQALEFYAFVHYNINTYTDMEWGTGAESPELFNPSELDCDQWAKTFKDAGMKGVIITAKHHDGFCLWPSAYTAHSVKNAPWKDGKGDVIRDLSDACKKYGLKLGIYYSPWDRNHPDYGTPAYLTYMRNQLEELLTQYGEVFEVWFDGANGGTDKLSYYDWEITYDLIRKWQPNAVIFSDSGPDVRWVGNEQGHAYPTTWSNLMRDSVYGGMPNYSTDWADGQPNGSHWVPAETNVSIRPGWYYHKYEDHKVKSLSKLVDIYYESVGMNTPLLLNFPVDQRGLVHETDAKQVQKLAEKIREDFATNLAYGSESTASSSRGPTYDVSLIRDGHTDTYWAAPDEVTTASIEFTFPQPTTVNRFLVQEYIALGQRVKSFTLEAKSSSGWSPVASETTIGYKRILRFDPVKTSAMRFTITDSKASPTITNIAFYNAPPLMASPVILRGRSGLVMITANDPLLQVYYTVDGTDPDSTSLCYDAAFLHTEPALISAIAFDPINHRYGEISTKLIDIAKEKWKPMEDDSQADNAIDDLESTFWTAPSMDQNEIKIDLGKGYPIQGFTYLPPQSRYFTGLITDYEFYVSSDASEWMLVGDGEFSNIGNSPILQRVDTKITTGRYIKLRAIRTHDGKPASFAEIGISTK